MKKYIVILGAILLIAAASTAYAYWENPKVTGGGSIATNNEGYATFGLVSQDGNGVSKKPDGITYKGNIEYVDHASGLNLHSVSFNTDGLVCTRPTPTSEQTLLPCTAAKITGTATVNGETGYSFVVNVEDNGEPGSATAIYPDRFDITIYKDGSVIYPTTGGNLTGGNIQVFGQVEFRPA